MGKTDNMMQDILYMQALQPEEGCDVDFAVGTTFSLSMEGLVAVPLSLSKFGESKSPGGQNALYLMEGIRRAADKFVVYCNKGSIHVPGHSQPLYSLLENSVVEVAEPNNPLANFHPKLWVIRESKDANRWIKLIITSRNLTFSTDLDAAVVIRGKVCNDVSNKRNKPLADMLRGLAEHYDTNQDRQQRVRALAHDLECVESFDFDSPLSNSVYKFFPMMLGKSGTSQSINDDCLRSRLYGQRVLVISPFIDSIANGGLLKEIKDNSDDLYLVTNENNVSEELYEMLPGHIYIPNTLLSEDDKCPVRLHAKIYLVEKGNTLYMYLGSANATNSAFARNSELMIGMRINNTKFDDVFDELVTKDNLYIPVDGAKVDAKEELEKRATENDMEHLLRWAVNSIDCADIVKKRNKDVNPYQVSVSFVPAEMQLYSITDDVCGRYAISVRPLQAENEWRRLQIDDLQWNLCLEALSEFYVVKVEDRDHNKSKSRICKVRTDDLHRFISRRNDSIVNSIVRSDNIMQYLDMILSEFPEYTFEEWEKRKKQRTTQITDGNNMNGGLPIYEKLLKASYETPERIQELKEVVGKLSDIDYAKDLKDLLNVFGINFKNKMK